MSHSDEWSDESDNLKSDYHAFLYLLRDAKPYAKNIIGALALILLASILTVVSARLLGKLIQLGFIEKNLRLAWTLGAAVISMELAALASTYCGRMVLAKATSLTIFNIRKKLFAKLDRLPMAFFDQQALGRTVTRMTYDVEGLESFFSGILARLLSACISLVVVLVAMLTTDLKIGLLLISAILPAVWLTYATRNPLRHWNREFARRNSAINSRLAEFLNGLPIIRSFGAENWSQQKFDERVNHHLQAAIKTNVLNSWARPFILALCQLPLLALLYFGGKSVLAGALGFGVFVAFVRYCEQFSRPINALANELHTIQQAFTNAERVAKFLSAEEEQQVLGKDGHLQPTKAYGDIEFKNVSMSYLPNQPILNSISLKIHAGSRVGLVGTTGSGKTSTVALIARLYDYQSGEIYVDGEPIRNLNRKWLRSQLGFISQDVVLFKGSIRENLRLDYPASDTEILKACEATGFLKLLENSSRTLDSEVLHQGLNLSVGERQVLALTRVLLRNPALMILDEATANVDPQTEQVIYTAVDRVMEGRTCLIIAHRLETLQSCQTLFVFNKGDIIEQGSHSELIAKKGYYYALQQNSLGAHGTPKDLSDISWQRI